MKDIAHTSSFYDRKFCLAKEGSDKDIIISLRENPHFRRDSRDDEKFFSTKSMCLQVVNDDKSILRR